MRYPFDWHWVATRDFLYGTALLWRSRLWAHVLATFWCWSVLAPRRYGADVWAPICFGVKKFKRWSVFAQRPFGFEVLKPMFWRQCSGIDVFWCQHNFASMFLHGFISAPNRIKADKIWLRDFLAPYSSFYVWRV